MKSSMTAKLVNTGTNTDIGKTVISAVLVEGMHALYWKPIQTGIVEGSDTEWIREKTGLPESHFYPETYRLKQPLSPHAAAALDGIEISLHSFEMPPVPATETLIIEGAGGIMVPLNKQHFMLDLMKKLDVPVLLVADSELGTINHTLLSLEHMRRNDVTVLGVVMNGAKNPGNRQAIERYGNISVLAEIEPLAEITPHSLKDCFQGCFAS